MMTNRSSPRKWGFIAVLAALALVAGLNSGALAQTNQGPLLPGSSIPQWVNTLPTLAAAGGTMENVILPGPSDLTTLYMRAFRADMLPAGTPLVGPPYQGTRVFGYRRFSTTASADTYIGPVFVTERGTSTGIRYVNNLGATNSDLTPPFWPASFDQTLHWANPNNLPMYVAQGAATPFTVVPNPDRALATYSGPIPAVPHLHGGEQPAAIDGGPDQWYLSTLVAPAGYTQHGPQYYTSTVPTDVAAANEAIFRYPNVMEAAPTWFHDHLLGGTRMNVYAGLAGAYLLTDPALVLPAGLTATGLSYDPPTNSTTSLTIPLVLQDRSFTTSGELFFPNVGLNPEHPFWIPEFIGDTVVVNGKAWPNLNVEAKRYRFLMINGSNARFYELSLGNNVPMYVVGTDGGYLDNAVQVNKLVIGPGERYQLIIDFGKYAGKKIIMTNTGRTPFPKGTPPAGSTLGRIVQFTVTGPPAIADNSFNPAGGAVIRTGDANNPKIQRLAVADVSKTRQLTLNEVIGPGGPLEILVNNTKWSGKRQTTNSIPENTPAAIAAAFEPIPGSMSDGVGNWLTELPDESTTELWQFINLTADAHPIHLHLVQFQLLNRQNFNVNRYMGAYNAAFPAGFDFTVPPNGGTVGPGVFIPSFGPPANYNTGVDANGNQVTTFLGGNPDVTPFLQGMASPPLANEAGWKDTVIMYPGQVTSILVRFAPQDTPSGGVANFAFTPNPPNPNAVGGDLANFDFVHHCHIVDHEDNEMMRPYQVIPATDEASRDYQIGVNY